MWKFIVDVVHDFVSSLQPDVGRGFLHVSNVFLFIVHSMQLKFPLIDLETWICLRDNLIALTLQWFQMSSWSLVEWCTVSWCKPLFQIVMLCQCSSTVMSVPSILSSLLQTQNRCAYNLARDLIKRSANALEPYVQIVSTTYVTVGSCGSFILWFIRRTTRTVCPWW